jgi:single-strand DNA-binding protein
MINKVLLIGRTAAKPSLKEGKSGTKYCSFSLATNSGYGDKKQTDWHDITSFGKTAEVCSQFIEKGSLVAIEGRISYDKYEKDGKTTKTTRIIADNVTFLSNKQQ